MCIKKILNIYISLSRKGLTESLRVPLKMCVGCVHQVMCTTPTSTQGRGNKLLYSGRLSSSTCIRQFDYFKNKDGKPYFTDIPFHTSAQCSRVEASPAMSPAWKGVSGLANKHSSLQDVFTHSWHSLVSAFF